jgi:hypothetical protein
MSGSTKASQALTVETIYAWVATWPDGGERIMGHLMPNGNVTPLFSPDRTRALSFRPMAERYAHAAGTRARLRVFVGTDVIEEIG